MKSEQMRSFFWYVFFRIWTGYGDLLSRSPYSVRIREKRTRKSSVFGHFSSNVKKMKLLGLFVNAVETFLLNLSI